MFAPLFREAPDDAGGLYDIVQQIKEDYDPEDHIFTGFNNGAYFEYMGFRNIYIDARPELYTSQFTKDKNILRDYTMAAYGLVKDPFATEDDPKVRPVTASEMEQWLQDYRFRYILVEPNVESFLYGYLLEHEGYDLVNTPEKNPKRYALFKQSDMG